MNFKDRLFAKIEICGDDECWPYIGGTAVQRNTYGQIHIGKSYRKPYVTAPHAVLMIMLGRELHDGMYVCHMCHWKPCCNPRHLTEGTPSQNMMMNPPDVRARGGLANKGVPKNKNHGEKQRIAQRTSRMRECSDCGLKTNAGALGRHQTATGHGGSEIKIYDVKWTAERHAKRELSKKTCECGLTTFPAQLSRHMKVTGHNIATQ